MKVYRSPDVATAAADIAATVALVTLAWTTSVLWWWPPAAAWAYLTYRQIRLVRRATTLHGKRTPPPASNGV